MELITGLAVGVFILILAIIIAVYVIEAIFLNKLYYLEENKKTSLGWIPVANIYLLGKVTFNEKLGWGLIAVFFLQMEFTTTVNGVANTYTILPSGLHTIISSMYNLAVTGLLIYAIVKYFNLKNAKTNPVAQNNMNNIPNQMNNQPVNNYQMNTVDNSMNMNMNNQNNYAQQQNIESNVAPNEQQTKFCTNCGKQVNTSSAFCTNCGNKLN